MYKIVRFLYHFIENRNLKARFASYIVLLRMILYTPPAGRREKRRQGKVHDKEDFQDPREDDNEDLTTGDMTDKPKISFDALGGNDSHDQYEDQKPKRKIRIAKP